jgi:hypothetical protein
MPDVAAFPVPHRQDPQGCRMETQFLWPCAGTASEAACSSTSVAAPRSQSQSSKDTKIQHKESYAQGCEKRRAKFAVFEGGDSCHPEAAGYVGRMLLFFYCSHSNPAFLGVAVSQ